jgi:hypothetical protein
MLICSFDMKHDPVGEIGLVLDLTAQHQCAHHGDVREGKHKGAPSNAKATVCAIGLNIFPSIPSNVKIGR